MNGTGTEATVIITGIIIVGLNSYRIFNLSCAKSYDKFKPPEDKRLQ